LDGGGEKDEEEETGNCFRWGMTGSETDKRDFGTQRPHTRRTQNKQNDKNKIERPE